MDVPESPAGRSLSVRVTRAWHNSASSTVQFSRFHCATRIRIKDEVQMAP
jgi:hypothetical protein